MKEKREKRIYTVATVHLDTTWSWSLETTLNDYIPKTLKENFERLEKYPDYIFSFEGAYRYELIQEYFPEAFKKIREYERQGRWNIGGSGWENGDVNIPSPEALFRNFLYGNNYFEEKFSKRCIDIYLPDCFGFGLALPSVAAHSNLKAFTTQKLAWSCAYGIPFDIGWWYGVDGKRMLCEFDARDYNYNLKTARGYRPVRRKMNSNSRQFNMPWTSILYGIGDRGGAPREESVKGICKDISKNESEEIKVIPATTQTMFNDILSLPPEVQESLPHWDKELTFTDHAAGCYTSRTPSKRFNRKCEVLADCAERMSVFASLLGLAKYPDEKLRTAWKRVIAHQFHDDITGTSNLDCYERNWNDYVMSLNEFAHEYESACLYIAGTLDTSFVKGEAVVVNNPTAYERNECVQAVVPMKNARNVRVYDSNGFEVPSQIANRDPEKITIAFCANVPSMGFACYDVRECEEVCKIDSGLSLNGREIENKNLKVKLNDNGDISEIFDKRLNRQILKSPVSMDLIDFDGSQTWPSWELDYKESRKKPVLTATNPVFKVLENGQARIVIEISRTARKSVFIQKIILDAHSDYLRVENEIDWRSLCTLLKTPFSFNLSNPIASYDLGLGVIKRENAYKRLYEVPAQQWADITDAGGEFGVSVLSDSRCGWDKFDDSTLRLTGVYSPRVPFRSMQHLQDFGINRYAFGIFPHSGSYKNGTGRAAACFNTPMNCFRVPVREGALSSVSMGRLDNENVIVRAVKKAEYTDEIIVRFNEISGEEHRGVQFEMFTPIVSAREVFASEEHIEHKEISGCKLIFDIGAYGVKTFALTVKSTTEFNMEQKNITLKSNETFFSPNDSSVTTSLPLGQSIPLELCRDFTCGGVEFTLNPENTLLCDAQELYAEGFDKIHIIAASFDGDINAEFTTHEKCMQTIQSADELIGTWDLYAENKTGHIKRDRLAFTFTHRHLPTGDERGKILNFFKYTFDISSSASLTLPKDKRIAIISATATKGEPLGECLSELYDSLEKRELDFSLTKEEKAYAKRTKLGYKKSRAKFLFIFARNRMKREIEQVIGVPKRLRMKKKGS